MGKMTWEKFRAQNEVRKEFIRKHGPSGTWSKDIWAEVRTKLNAIADGRKDRSHE